MTEPSRRSFLAQASAALCCSALVPASALIPKAEAQTYTATTTWTAATPEEIYADIQELVAFFISLSDRQLLEWR